MRRISPYLTVLSVLTVFAATASAGSGSRQPIQRNSVFTHNSLESAWKTAVTRQRPLLVMFTTDGCHYCDKMLAQTYSHPMVKQMLSASTETVKVRARDYPNLVGRLSIRGYPTSILVSPEGNVLGVVKGFADAKSFTHRISPLLKNSALSSNRTPSHTTVAAQIVER